jgi:hypothetical protein
MIESNKTKRLVWVLSLTLGPVVYCILLLILLLTPPGTPNIAAVKDDLIDLAGGLASFWATGFAFVWFVYWSGKFIVKYGPFM